MKRLTFLLLSLCVAGLSASHHHKYYHHNEVWDPCGCRDRTCDDLSEPKCPPHVCNPGWYCKCGYVRSACGSCILVEDCPSRCPGKNESWQICHGGCERTCRNPYNMCNGCVDGCFCSPGFVRGDCGNCILYRNCF